MINRYLIAFPARSLDYLQVAVLDHRREYAVTVRIETAALRATSRRLSGSQSRALSGFSVRIRWNESSVVLVWLVVGYPTSFAPAHQRHGVWHCPATAFETVYHPRAAH